MKKVLFIDRDGTIILEPPVDYQVDSFEKLAFYPKAITNLYKIATELDYELVMVTNQDGLGTDVYPEDTFWGPHNLMLDILKGEGIEFAEVVIDRTFSADNQPTRKPGTALLTKYFDETKYDLANSFVLGDRLTDVQLAKNLGGKGIFIGKSLDLSDDDKCDADVRDYIALQTDSWDDIYQLLRFPDRISTIKRTTKETDIDIVLNLDGKGDCDIKTGLAIDIKSYVYGDQLKNT